MEQQLLKLPVYWKIKASKQLNLAHYFCLESVLKVRVPEHSIWGSQNQVFILAMVVVKALIPEVHRIHLS